MKRQFHKVVGVTIMEILVGLVILISIVSFIFHFLTGLNLQRRQLERQMTFTAAALEFFEILKADLRSIEEISIFSDAISIVRVVEIDNDGNDHLESVSYNISDDGVVEKRQDRSKIHRLLTSQELSDGHAFSGEFLVDNMFEQDGFHLARLRVLLSINPASADRMIPLAASMTVDLRGRSIRYEQ